MAEQIKFQYQTTFTGRNGTFRASGLSIATGKNVIEIAPITSKGKLGNCYIGIPKEAIPALVSHLLAEIIEIPEAQAIEKALRVIEFFLPKPEPG